MADLGEVAMGCVSIGGELRHPGVLLNVIGPGLG